MLLPQKSHFFIENGFVVLLIVEKSFMELVASGREGQCLGEKFCYVIEFWLAAWFGGACWYSTAMEHKGYGRISALDK